MSLLYDLIVLVLAVSAVELLDIVSDLTPEDCHAMSKDYIYANPKTNGLPSCKTFSGTTTKCNSYFTPLQTSQMIYQPTSCAKDGTFGPKQCKGDRITGRCFCFDQNGHRIYGQEWWSKADDMTCACSRKKADLSDSTNADYVFFNSLHCNSLGNYEPLQCDILSQQCWCAEEKTGALTSPVVPQVAMSKLPCYESATVGNQYLRQCDNWRYGLKNLQNQFALRGTVADAGDIQCDGDGAYGAYAHVEGQVYCTWRDNTKIGSWASNYPPSLTLDCNCARDTKIFSDQGKEQPLQCSPSGDYQRVQGMSPPYYCVDKDGFRKSVNKDTIQLEIDCEAFTSYSDNP